MQEISFAKKWTMAARPKTLIASMSPVLFGNLMALKPSGFSILVFSLTLSFALLIQIGTNFVNDYFDCKKGIDTEDRVGPVRVMQAKLISPLQMKAATFLVFAFSTLIGIFLTYIGGIWIFTLMLLAIIMAFAYTAGPYPLSHIGIADLTVLIFFGPVATLGSYYLQTKTLSLAPMIAGFCAGFFSCAMLTANNLRDEKQDRGANKRTLIVRYGQRFGQIEYTISLLTPFLLLGALKLYLPLLSLIFCMRPVKRIYQNKDLPLVLKETSFVMLSYTLLFCANLMLFPQ